MAITIAIPFYNAEKYLLDAIKSVFAQTYQDWELLLIDDGSTDGSLQIAQSIKDSRVRVISDGKNKKIAARLNEVTRLAKYDYIARMDADDLMDPKRLEIQLKYLQANPKIDLVSTGTYSILNDNTLIGMRGQDFEGIPTIEELIYRKVNILHASVLARKSWYLRNSYDETLPVAQDYDLWLNAAKKKDLYVKIIKEPLYIYREEGNVTYEKLKKAYTQTPKIFNKHIDNKTIKCKFILKSKLKLVIIKIIYKLGLLYKLQEKRSDLNLDKQEIDNYNKILDSIKKQSL